MTTEPKEAGTLDDSALRDIEKDVAGLEDHNFVEAPPSGVRVDLSGLWKWTIFVVGLTLAVFHVYTAPVFAGTLPNLRQGAIHLGVGLGLVFLLYPVKPQETSRQRIFGWVLTAAGVLMLVNLFVGGAADWYVVAPAFGVLLLVQLARYLPWTLLGMPPGDLVLSVLGVFCGFYVFVNYEDIVATAGLINTPNIVVGTIAILLILVAAQRTLGSALVILAGLMLAYAYYGPVMPGFLNHGGYTVDRIVNTTFFTTEGVFGTPIWVSATVIFLFLVFAAMLQRTGMERFFTDLALGSTGWATGGTAKVGVATSVFSGTITGSSVANTVSNGAFTIPMMKKSGYNREYAGAVEAASSTGGQITPPIMGAGVFIMMEITGVPYAEILIAAIIPAILFFVGQFVVVHYDSKKFGIRGLPKRMLPSVRRLMATKGYLFIPIAAIFVLLSMGLSPGYAAMAAIGVSIGINLLIQIVAPLIALVPNRAGATPEAARPQQSRLVGSLLLLLGIVVVALVAWGATIGLGRVAPEMAQRDRITVVAIALGLLVAVISQVVIRLRGMDAGADPMVAESPSQGLGEMGRLMAPIATIVVAIALFYVVLEGLAPGLSREWRVLAVTFGISVLATVISALFGRWRRETESDEKLTFYSVVDGLVSTTRIALPIIVACAAAGMIAGVITLTGLGHTLADGLVGLGEVLQPSNLLEGLLTPIGLGFVYEWLVTLGGWLGLDVLGTPLIPVMVMSMLACLILGIGLPTTANYVVTATLAAPAILILLRGDLDESTVAMLLMAHLFVYYFGVMADITPPVCLAAYAASGISGGDPIRTGVQSVRIAVSGFLVPFMFVLSPELLLQEVTWAEGIHAATTAVIGASLVGVAVVGFINRHIGWGSRILIGLAGIMLLDYGWEYDLVGLAIAAAIFGAHYWSAKGVASGKGVVPESVKD